LARGGADLTTSAAGKMTMQVIAAVAEFERDLLVGANPGRLGAR
jgi:putative DNA-invertase from lambdoid prophage Rac